MEAMMLLKPKIKTSKSVISDLNILQRKRYSNEDQTRLALGRNLKVHQTAVALENSFACHPVAFLTLSVS